MTSSIQSRAPLDHISKLSIQIKNKIAVQLKPSEVFNCTKVCKMWKHLFSSNLLWKTINTNHPLIRKKDPLNNTNPFKAYLQNERIKHNIDELNFETHKIFPSKYLGFDVNVVSFYTFWNNDLVIQARALGQNHYLIIKDDGSVKRLNDGTGSFGNPIFVSNNYISNIVAIHDKLIANTPNRIYELSTDKKPNLISNFKDEISCLIALQDNLLVGTSNSNNVFLTDHITLLSPQGQILKSFNIEDSHVLSLGNLLCLNNKNSFTILNENLEFINQTASIYDLEVYDLLEADYYDQELTTFNESLIINLKREEILSITSKDLINNNLSFKYLCHDISPYCCYKPFNDNLICFQESDPSHHIEPHFHIYNFKDASLYKIKAVLNNTINISEDDIYTNEDKIYIFSEKSISVLDFNI
ncbi:MAG: F-box protein [Parachlamydiales bacterium]|nr:F-box protein [Parachlamydiales bacterium]